MFKQKFLRTHRAKTAKVVFLSLVIPMLFFCLPQAKVNAMDGNALVEWMKEYSKYSAGNAEYSLSQVGMFAGYVQGFVDATMFFAVHAKLGDLPGIGDVNSELLRISNSPFYNPSSHIPLMQLLAIVEKYIQANPDKWNIPAAALVRDALFPF